MSKRVAVSGILCFLAVLMVACAGGNPPKGPASALPPGDPKASTKPTNQTVASNVNDDAADELVVKEAIRQRDEAIELQAKIRASNEEARKSYEVRLTKYKEAKAKYDQEAYAQYRKKMEYDAIKQLEKDRLFSTDVILKEFWRDVIKAFPDTEAAKEAQRRIAGNSPKKVPLPSLPSEYLVEPSPPSRPAYEREPTIPTVPTVAELRERRILVAKEEAARKVEEKTKEAARLKAIEENRPRPTRANYNKIRFGMSLAEAQAILGPGKENASAPGFQIVSWQSHELLATTVITITFENNRVSAKAIFP